MGHLQGVGSPGHGTGRSRGRRLFWRGTLRFTLGSHLIHRFAVGPLRTLGSAFFLSCTLSSACTLITDVDRQRIPTEEPPVFPENDAGPDAAPNEVDPVDAGSPDAGESLTDAGADGGDELADAGADAG
jgi:hypothetical protein